MWSLHWIAHRAELWERRNGRFDEAVKVQNTRKRFGDSDCQTDDWAALDDEARRMT